MIAYLAPELPALSATFVYEELLGLERRGVRVLPVSVRAPASPARGQEALARRTQILYDRPTWAMAAGGLADSLHFGTRTLKALGWLITDMLHVSPWRPAAWKLAYQWLAAARLARLLEREHVRHLHVHFAHTPTQIAMYASAFSGIPFSATAHANDIFERGLLLKEKARRSLKILTISEFNLAFLRSIGLPQDKLAIVRCGVSFAPRSREVRFDSRRTYRVGTLCRLVEKKGVDDLIRALAHLRGAPWSVELRIAGDGPLRAPLEALVAELDLRDSVHFEGALRHDEVTAWLHSLDVFAMPCKADANGDMDGIPVSLMEAMSQRVPVVSTRLSGIPELVIHDRTGLLADPADPASVAAQLRRLFDEPTLRARLTEAAVDHVQAEFGQAANLDRLMRFIGQSEPTQHAPARQATRP